MDEKILIINAGSSSLKFSLYGMPNEVEIVNGVVERIGEEESCYSLKFNGKKIEGKKVITDHTGAVQTMLNELLSNQLIKTLDEIHGVGNRILHGGEIYSDSVLIDEKVLKDIKDLTVLGPLHHPGELAAIFAIKRYLPKVPQVAVFDTAFNQTMPKEEFMYAIPKEFYHKDHVRRYGFHGTSYKYITRYMQKELNKENVNLIICHIGSGASVACIKDGKCYATSMGMTPLAGVVMGTRSGDIDPSIIPYLCERRHLTVNQVNSILNKNSGLKGLSGKNDFRDNEELAKNGNEDAKLAIAKLRESIKDYIGSYYFKLDGNVDAIIFTAGIGENVSSIREDLVNSMSHALGVKLNKEMNDNIAKFKKYQTGVITTDDSKTKVMVIPTNEEYIILKDAYRLSKITENKQKKLVK